MTYVGKDAVPLIGNRAKITFPNRKLLDVTRIADAGMWDLEMAFFQKMLSMMPEKRGLFF